MKVGTACTVRRSMIGEPSLWNNQTGQTLFPNKMLRRGPMGADTKE